ncbi:MAG: class I SAM-dependent methyltransferase [Acidimicrobiia bacterium]
MTPEGVDVKALMAEVEAEVERKRAAGLYPPEVLVELDVPSAADGGGRRVGREADNKAVNSALGDLSRSSHFTALVTTASQKPLVAPLVSGARRAIRSGLTWYMNGILSQLSRFADTSVRAIGLVNERANVLEEHLAQLEDRVAFNEVWRESVEGQRIGEHLKRLDNAVRDLRNRLEGTAAGAPATAGGAAAVAAAAEAGSAGYSFRAERSFDYLEFENRFRGDPQAIADRQAAYVDLFRGATLPVVDIGCGRGEFLGLLREAGVPCYGLDRHPDMVETCRQQGLEVVEADSLEHLASVEEGSLGGIFCSQMVEHLAPADVPGFFELANRAVAVGAPFVVETINPESLFVFAHAFYVDLGHLRPLHPLTLEFLAEMAGFSSVKVEYVSPVPPDFRPEKLPAPVGGDGALDELVTSLEENFRRIDDILFGPQDFAVVAIR